MADKERRIQDYDRKRLPVYRGRQPPFKGETEARAYIKGAWGIGKEEDVQRLLKWYLPILYQCNCPDAWADNHHGAGLRMQYDCGSFYRCSNCGEERNKDGSKHIRQYVTDVEIKPEKEVSSEQLSLLDWKEDEND